MGVVTEQKSKGDNVGVRWVRDVADGGRLESGWAGTWEGGRRDISDGSGGSGRE